MVIKHFTDLEAWKIAHELVVKIYIMTKKFPKEELFGITNQLRRAVTSITANIAEGMGRGSYLDRCRFYYNARGSVYEVESFIYTSKSLGYVSTDEFSLLKEKIDSSRRLLNGLIRKTKTLKNFSS